MGSAPVGTFGEDLNIEREGDGFEDEKVSPYTFCIFCRLTHCIHSHRHNPKSFDFISKGCPMILSLI